MKVIGAGMAGLLAAGMLRKECSGILEAKPSLPDNHSAVLRFKSPVVGDTLNIPFKKVKAMKAIHPWKNPVADVMAYSQKTNGDYTLRSITSATGELVERYVAPANFPSRMAEAVQCEINFNTPFAGMAEGSEPLISTLPMPVMMDLLGWKNKPSFRSIAGVSISARIEGCDMYCSLYVPDPGLSPYRISINGDQLIVEVALHGHPSLWNDGDAEVYLLQALGILQIPKSRVKDHKFKRQPYMKILPVDETIRRSFIIWASEKHQIYSLGRFATWRTNLLLDDVVNDVRVIQKIHQTTNYEHRSKA